MKMNNRNALIYGSCTGKTESIAEDIIEAFLPELSLQLIDVSSLEAINLSAFEIAICGIPTWDIGELEYGWSDLYDELDNVDLSGVQVAMFGLGDQRNYGDTYQDAMGILYKKLIECGAFGGIGFTQIDGHEFEESLAIVDGHFCGLALDEDNQDELSAERIRRWTGQVTTEIRLSNLNLKADQSAPIIDKAAALKNSN